MTATELAETLRDYARKARTRSRTNRYEHSRNRAAGEAKAYETAAELVELIEKDFGQ